MPSHDWRSRRPNFLGFGFRPGETLGLSDDYVRQDCEERPCHERNRPPARLLRRAGICFSIGTRQPVRGVYGTGRRRTLCVSLVHCAAGGSTWLCRQRIVALRCPPSTSGVRGATALPKTSKVSCSVRPLPASRVARTSCIVKKK